MDVMQGSVVLMSAGVVAAAAVVKDYGRKSMRRRQELEEAAGALTEHFDALEKFIHDPESPRALSEFLLDFSDAIEDERTADAIVNMSPPEAHRPVSGGLVGEIQSQLDALRLKRRDLVVVFDIAVGSGLTAMALQSDRNAVSFETMSRQFTADPNREIVAASRAVSKTRKQPGWAYENREVALAGHW